MEDDSLSLLRDPALTYVCAIMSEGEVSRYILIFACLEPLLCLCMQFLFSYMSPLKNEEVEEPQCYKLKFYK